MTHWSATTGGASGASAPTSADSATFDGNSGGGTVTTSGALTVLALTQASGNTTSLVPGGSLTITGTFTFTAGTFDNSVNNQAITAARFNATSGGTVKLAAVGTPATITITGAAGPWTVVAGVTFTAGASTIVLSDTSATAKTFAGGGKTYHNLQIAAGTGTVTFTGSNTFDAITANGVPIALTSSTTQTITAASGFQLVDLTLTAVTSGTAASISVASGSVNGYVLALKDITATGGATFTDWSGTNTSGNTGWTFSTITASASLSITGSATGTPALTASGAIALTGAGAGGAFATATGSLAITGSATGAATGAGTASVSLTGAVNSSAIATATGSLVITGSATGGGTGTASGALSLSGAASGQPTASATGTLTLTGSGAGRATAAATGSLVITAVGTGQAQTGARGFLSLTASATGIKISIGHQSALTVVQPALTGQQQSLGPVVQPGMY